MHRNFKIRKYNFIDSNSPPHPAPVVNLDLLTICTRQFIESHIYSCSSSTYCCYTPQYLHQTLYGMLKEHYGINILTTVTLTNLLQFTTHVLCNHCRVCTLCSLVFCYVTPWSWRNNFFFSSVH